MFKKTVFFVSLLLIASGAYIYFGSWEKKSRIPKSKNTKERDLILGETDFERASKEDSAYKLCSEKQWALKDIGIEEARQQIKLRCIDEQCQAKYSEENDLDRVKKKQCKERPKVYLSKKEKNLVKQCVERYTGGQGVIVAVCDTGIHLKHPCLKSNLWVNKKEIPNNGIDDDKNGYIDDIHGWNFVDNNNDVQDWHGHGTHISGIIAATGKTKTAPECRMCGIAAKAQIMTLKYYDSENGENNIKNTVKCVEYAINNGAHIINYSGGGPGENLDEQAIIAKANDKEIIFVAASGNEGEDIKKVKHSYYPASYKSQNIISFNSKDLENKILESSNWVKSDWRQRIRGKTRNQTAPGYRIFSTLPPERYIQSSFVKNIFRGLAGKVRRSIPETFFDFLPHPLRNIAKIKPDKHNNYGYMTGTSQATGFASGVAAVLKSSYPNWSYLQIKKQMETTGYSSKAQSIKQKTNQGKFLNLKEAMSMRDKVPLTDVPESTGKESGKEVGIAAPPEEQYAPEGDPLLKIQEVLKQQVISK